MRAGKRGMSTSAAKKVVVVDGSRTPFALASTYVLRETLNTLNAEISLTHMYTHA